MRVKQRFLLSFSLVVATLILLTLLSLGQTAIIEQEVNRVETDWMPSIRALGMINSAVSSSARLIYELVEENDPARRSVIAAELRSQLRWLTVEKDRYRDEMVSSTEERELYKGFDYHWSSYMDRVPAIVAAAEAGDKAKAVALIREAYPTWTQASRDLDNVIEFNTRKSAESTHEVRTALVNGRRNIIVFLAVGLLVTGALLFRTAKVTLEYERQRNLISVMVDSSQAFIVTVGKDGKVRTMNKAMLAALGYTPEEVVGQDYISLVIPEADRAALWEYLAKLRDGTKSTEYENTILDKNGQPLRVDWRAGYVWGDDGLSLIFGIGIDVTERRRDERELAESKKRAEMLAANMRAIFDSSPDLIWAVDREGKLMFLNEAIRLHMLHKYGAQIAIGGLFREALDPERNAFWEKIFRRAFDGERFVDFTQLESGKVLEFTVNPVVVGGETAAVAVYGRDVTERRRAERALAESKQETEMLAANLKAILDSSQDSIVAVDKDFRLTFCNQTVYEIVLEALGVRMGIGTRPEEVFPPEDAALWLQAYQQAMDEGRYLFEYEYVSGQEKRVVECSMSAVQAKDGVAGAAVYCKDITKRRQAERELAESKRETEMMAANMKAIFDSSQDAIMAVDKQYRTIFFNEAVQEYIIKTYGTSLKIGKTADLTPEDVDFWKRAYQRVLEEGRYSFEYTRRDGRIVEGTLNPVQLKDEVVGIALFSKDMTERRRAEQALKEANDTLERKVAERTNELAGMNLELTAMNEELTAMNEEIVHVNEELTKAKEVVDAATRAKSAFIANMSHEIRTPMNAILGFSQLLQREAGLPPQQRHYLENIDKAGAHLLELIEGVLDMSKIEAGRITLRPAEINLHAMLRDVEQMFRLRAEAKGLRFAVELADDLPQVVKLDEGRLRQVLINLLGNAVKFTAEGSITLRAGFVNGNGDEVRLEFEVEDTGVGIAPEDSGRLFRAFEQARAGLEAEGGTGLGLAISREIVRMMRGDISVSGQPGQGSLFRFSVLALKSDQPPLPAAREMRRVKAVKGGRVYRVLVADDAALNRHLLTVLLRKLGFETIEAANGQEAVEAVRAWRPDLIIMDIRMPVMNGIVAMRLIRSTEETRDVPIVAVTASAFANDREEIMDAGADAFLSKPCDEAELLELIGNLLKLEYEYEAAGEAVTPEAAPPAAGALSGDVLSRLPRELVRKLHDAANEGDFFVMLVLAEQVAEHDAGTAAILREMTQQYKFEQLIALLDEAGL